MKVVWLCHFSNQEVQEILKPRKKIGEIAPWISSLIKLMEGRGDIELHIISPHEYIKGRKEFNIRSVRYYFFNAYIPIWGKHWPGFFKFDYWTNFIFTKHKIRKVINRINPDIIHLHGAENAYYSSSIFQFKNIYPVLITIQGFISHTTLAQNNQLKKRMRCEQEILKCFTHFGYRTLAMGKDILSLNPKAKLHWHYYAFPEVKPYNLTKKYDVVFFARVSKDKGIEDLLKAISIIKPNLPDITVCIIGAASLAYLNFLKKKAAQLGIFKNIYWAGFLPSQADVHKIASSSRISVLPTWHDTIPGTIIESMRLKLPVVAYSVGGIPEINDGEECISLVAKGDVNALAEKILWLLENPEIQKLQSEKAYLRAVEMFNNAKIPGDLLNAYKEVINDFKRK